jgi:hypothetical protein
MLHRYPAEAHYQVDRAISIEHQSHPARRHLRHATPIYNWLKPRPCHQAQDQAAGNRAGGLMKGQQDLPRPEPGPKRLFPV